MKKDFHFKHENTERKPNRVNFLKPKPAVPINSLRNPSVKKEEKTDYDDVSVKNIEERLYKIGFVDINSDIKEQEVEDVKIYNPKPHKPDLNPIPDDAEKTRKMLLWAVILGALGILFLGLGIFFWINLY